MNLERVELLKTALRTHPEHYDQNIFLGRNVCGSVACIAGYAYLLETGVDLEIAVTTKDLWPTVPGVARDWLELTLEQSGILFGESYNWPLPFRFDISDNLTSAQQVERACLFLDHIAGGGEVFDASNECLREYVGDGDYEEDDEEEDE